MPKILIAAVAGVVAAAAAGAWLVKRNRDRKVAEPATETETDR